MFSGQFASWVRFPFNHGDNDQWRAGFGFPLSMVTMTSGLWHAGFGFLFNMVIMTSGHWHAHLRAPFGPGRSSSLQWFLSRDVKINSSFFLHFLSLFYTYCNCNQ